MKIIVRSTNPERGLLNSNQEWLVGHRPTVATVSHLLEGRLAKGDFRLLVGNLSDEATDEEFQRYLKESGDEQLALDAFEASFTIEENRKAVTAEGAQSKLEKEKADLKRAEDEKLKAAADSKLKADAAAKEKADADAKVKADAAAKEKAAVKPKAEAARDAGDAPKEGADKPKDEAPAEQK